jgi:D-glycero-alpha-D-manno-heptose-7-phosphate kinase
MKSQRELAEEAFQITQNLNLPDGKQDPYIGALGGFVVMEIAQDDSVKLERLRVGKEISAETIKKFQNNSLFFYTGVRRDSESILNDQKSEKALEVKHRMKEIGRETLEIFQNGNLDVFGHLMNEHWNLKKITSEKITAPEIDEAHEFCLKNGAIGGKLVGAGGGGYLLFYCRAVEDKIALAKKVADRGMKVIPLEIDDRGSRVHKVLI